jgi:hypothetical protein
VKTPGRRTRALTIDTSSELKIRTPRLWYRFAKTAGTLVSIGGVAKAGLDIDGEVAPSAAKTNEDS